MPFLLLVIPVRTSSRCSLCCPLGGFFFGIDRATGNKVDIKEGIQDAVVLFLIVLISITMVSTMKHPYRMGCGTGGERFGYSIADSSEGTQFWQYA